MILFYVHALRLLEQMDTPTDLKVKDGVMTMQYSAECANSAPAEIPGIGWSSEQLLFRLQEAGKDNGRNGLYEHCVWEEGYYLLLLFSMPSSLKPA